MLEPGQPLRLRPSGVNPFLRYGDSVLPQLIIKASFGEFAARPIPGDRLIEIDESWQARNIRRATLPVLGEVMCHRSLIPQLRAAMKEVVARDLGYTIQPEQYAGCFGARFHKRGAAASPQSSRLGHRGGHQRFGEPHGNTSQPRPPTCKRDARARLHVGRRLVGARRNALRVGGVLAAEKQKQTESNQHSGGRWTRFRLVRPAQVGDYTLSPKTTASVVFRRMFARSALPSWPCTPLSPSMPAFGFDLPVLRLLVRAAVPDRPLLPAWLRV